MAKPRYSKSIRAAITFQASLLVSLFSAVCPSSSFRLCSKPECRLGVEFLKRLGVEFRARDFAAFQTFLLLTESSIVACRLSLQMNASKGRIDSGRSLGARHASTRRVSGRAASVSEDAEKRARDGGQPRLKQQKARTDL